MKGATEMRKGKIPEAVLQRLTQYLRLLLLTEEDQVMITSKQLGDMAGYTAPRVRNDFHYFGEFGMLGKGYDRKELISCIEKVFGLDRNHVLLVMGADPVGLLLLKRALCAEYEFDIKTELDFCDGIAA